MDARLAILVKVDNDATILGSLRRAQIAFVEMAGSGTLPEPYGDLVSKANARRGKLGLRTVSKGTLIRWRAAREEQGAIALAPVASRDYERPWLKPFREIYGRPSKPSVAACYELLESEGVVLPALRNDQKVIANLGALERNAGRMGPRDLKSLRSYIVRDFSTLRPGDVYTADGHTPDFEVQHPVHGRPFRPELITMIDIATRRCVGWAPGLAESAWTVADSLRSAVERAGIPAILYVDNGCGFKNQYLDEAAIGLMARLGIEKKHSLPYNSQARGVAERFHRSCWIREGRALPAFVGKDMDREARQLVYKRSRRDVAETGLSNLVMAWDAFVEWAEERIAAYNARPHRSLAKVVDPATAKRRHRSPDDAWRAALDKGDWEPTAVAPEELDDLFRPYFWRQVRRATVSIGRKTYFHRALEEFDLHNRQVQVGIDIHDAERVWIRDEDGRLVCVAELDANKRPYFPQSAMDDACDKRATQRLKRLEIKADEIRAERAPNVINMRPSAADVLTAAEAETHRRLRTIEHEPAPREESPEDRFAHALDLMARLDAGETVDRDLEIWLSGYVQTAEYRGQKRTQEAFAELG